MSRFTEKMYRNARTATTGMVTGEPHEPVRHTWGEVHERARRIAGGLAAAGVGHGDAVGVLAADVATLSRTEIGELAEGTGGGSSAMPHKQNPTASVPAHAGSSE